MKRVVHRKEHLIYTNAPACPCTDPCLISTKLNTFWVASSLAWIRTIKIMPLSRMWKLYVQTIQASHRSMFLFSRVLFLYFFLPVNRNAIDVCQTLAIQFGNETNTEHWVDEIDAECDFPAILGWRKCLLGQRNYRSFEEHPILVIFHSFFIKNALLVMKKALKDEFNVSDW